MGEIQNSVEVHISTQGVSIYIPGTMVLYTWYILQGILVLEVLLFYYQIHTSGTGSIAFPFWGQSVRNLSGLSPK